MFPDAVIFDFDGVIVDTEPIHYKAFQQILEPLGLGYTWQEYTENYMGFDDRDAFREAFKRADKNSDENLLHELIDKKAAIFEEFALDITPYPGVLELLKELKEKEIPLAICSGALHSDILPVLIHLQILDYFTHIITANDVSISKPHPDSYLTAKSLLVKSFSKELKENSLIYAIEDTPAGIQSAKGAGLRVIAVTNSYCFEKLALADATTQTLSELLNGNWP
jgi:beta-phosphoglucomutase